MLGILASVACRSSGLHVRADAVSARTRFEWAKRYHQPIRAGGEPDASPNAYLVIRDGVAEGARQHCTLTFPLLFIRS